MGPLREIAGLRHNLFLLLHWRRVGRRAGLEHNVGRVVALGAGLVRLDVGPESVVVGDVLDHPHRAVLVAHRVAAGHFAGRVRRLAPGAGVVLVAEGVGGGGLEGGLLDLFGADERHIRLIY